MNLVPYNQHNLMHRKPLDSITYKQHESIRNGCDTVYERTKHSENDMWLRDRDKLLLSLMWTTGARITDVLNMREDNNKINFNDKSITFLVKKRKDRDKKTGYVGEFWHTITIDMVTLTEIMNYLHVWKVHGYLFPSYRNSEKPMTRQAVSLKLNKLAEVAGIPRKIHAHLWRHGLAMYLLSRGMSMDFITFRLAHSSTQVTAENYARFDNNVERAIIESSGIRFRED